MGGREGGSGPDPARHHAPPVILLLTSYLLWCLTPFDVILSSDIVPSDVTLAPRGLPPSRTSLTTELEPALYSYWYVFDQNSVKPFVDLSTKSLHLFTCMICIAHNARYFAKKRRVWDAIDNIKYCNNDNRSHYISW